MEIINLIIQAFLPNAFLLGAMLFFLLVSVLSKVGSGVYKNVFSLDYKFDWKYFLFGVLKGVIFALSVFGVAMVFSGVPIILAEAGLLTTAFAEAFSSTIMLVILAAACAKNIADAYENYKATLNVTKEDIEEFGVSGEENPDELNG